MKKILDWTSQEVANIFDEATLWSAPFGKMLLENIPMPPEASIVDIGFGTGFPLIELSQRFGPKSKVFGVDIWQEGINRAVMKIKTLGLDNVEIMNKSATEIKIEAHSIDLVTSNLGINNFEEKELVYAEIIRILKKGASLCLTTNPIGTFEELFDVFYRVLNRMGLKEELKKLDDSIARRKTKEAIISELEEAGFKLKVAKSDSANIKFVDGTALMNHSLIRIGFRSSWENMIREEYRALFFKDVIQEVNQIIDTKGVFVMSIPMLYFEFIAL